MNYKELLFNKDNVLTFYPELAVILNKYDKILAEKEYESGKKEKKRKAGTLGLNEAIIINQINYWCQLNEKSGKNCKDGYSWTYNTYEKWAEKDFPYWSADTIRKSIIDLEQKGIVVSTNEYNSYKIDNTKWYRVDCDKLQEIINIVTAEDERKEKEKKEKKEKANKSQKSDNETCDCVCESYIDGLGIYHKPIPENTNRDYNIEKEHTVSKDTGKVHTVVSERNNVSREKPIEKYLSLKDKETDMLKRVLKISLKNYDEETANEIFLTIEYFLMRYTQRTGKIHPILKDDTLERIIDTMARFEDCEYGHYEKVIREPGIFREIVDEYFNTDFGAINGGETNYRLPHFVSDEILSRIAQRVVEY